MSYKKRTKGRQAIVEAAKKMPPLYHKIPGEEFDIRKARTLWWLTKQIAVLEDVWNLVKQSGAIEYNSETGKWQGVDFESYEKNN